MTTAETSQIKPGTIAPNASISRKLKEFYDAVQEEGIPARFLDLLERLEAAENAQKANAKAVDAK
ncbi:NepR family anti-sigma factor [Rhizobium sp.]|uniref:NepR family anti-sigma factor n=1 Tax=Rhizobium sp. TaxID=391 RepID=UPI00289F5CBF